MLQVNVLYGHPTDPDAFEAYYAITHTFLMGEVEGHAESSTPSQAAAAASASA